MTVAIRRATLADAAALARLKLETFRETFVTGGFAIPYPPDDLAAFEAASYSCAAVAAALADPAKANWVAEEGARLLGYAQVGPCKLPHPDVAPSSGELQQLYVAEQAQGRGLGARLLTIALDHLAEVFPGPVWLGVWSGNLRAQAIYARRGFGQVGVYDFPVGTWRDREFIFRRN